jgi:outer membrane biosynthesis protein TonB
VRFTLPRAQFASSTADTAEETQPSPAKPDVPTTGTDNELQKERQRLEKAKKRKEEAEKAKDFATASDIVCYVIPDLEAQIEKLSKQQREEQEKRAAPVSQNKEDKRSHQTEVETESDFSDDESGSAVQDFYD